MRRQCKALWATVIVLFKCSQFTIANISTASAWYVSPLKKQNNGTWVQINVIDGPRWLFWLSRLPWCRGSANPSDFIRKKNSNLPVDQLDFPKPQNDLMREHCSSIVFVLRDKTFFTKWKHVTVLALNLELCVCVCARDRKGSNCCHMATLLLYNDMSILKWRLGQRVCACARVCVRLGVVLKSLKWCRLSRD